MSTEDKEYKLHNERTKRGILVVEDNDINRDILCQILGEQYRLLCAENGQTGLDILKEHHSEISAVILDLQMPVMNGYEFLEYVSEDDVLNKIPVLVTTSSNGEKEEARCLELGATDFIAKPYNANLVKLRVRNIIRMRESASALQELEYDELTGLYTKQAFLRHATKLVQENPDKQYVILGFDVENFKLTNSVYGEEKCDEFLAYIGEFLKRFSQIGLIGRFGGDQFVILYEPQKKRSSERLEYYIDYIQKNAPIPHQIFKVGIYGPLEQDLPMVRCCDRAFLAIREIKGVYGQTINHYQDSMRKQMMEEQRIKDNMEQALLENQFHVYYQPKHESMTGNVAGAEALVRWIHPEYGFMIPGQFIPLFEKTGFIMKLDEFVIRRVCMDIRRWMDQGLKVVPVSINISRRDCLEPGWIGRQTELINSFGIDHNLLHMEVTESLYAEKQDVIIETVKYVQNEGFVVEMDDFGTGYSSLGMLATLPLDVIKLDISFVRKLDVNEIVVENIIKLAKRMGFHTIAEGVETEKQFKILRDLGCDYIQGYYFSKPIPRDEYEAYLQKPSAFGDSFKGENLITQKWSDITSELEIKNTLLSCIEILNSDDDVVSRVNRLLALTCKFYGSDRAYIFEFVEDGKIARNTFEFCKDGISPQIQNLQDVPSYLVDGWVKSFDEKDEFALMDLEAIADSEPDLYAVLAPQQITSLISAPLRTGSDIIGFLGVDNPTVHLDSSELIRTSTAFLAKELSRSRYIGDLEEVSYRDALTGVKNRRAYYEDIIKIEADPKKMSNPVGIVYADVNGLKITNDQEGHEAGDRLIQEVANHIRSVFSSSYIYRLGGDEFIVFDFEDRKSEFFKKIDQLNAMWNEQISASLGCVWLKKAEKLEENISNADKRMYMEKSRYYVNRLGQNARHSMIAENEDILQMSGTVLDSLPGGFYAYYANDDATIITANKQLIDLYKCDNLEDFREFVGNSFKGMIHPDDYKLVYQKGNTLEDEDTDSQKYYIEYRIICKDGSVRYVRDYGRFAHSDIYGDVYYIFTVDITKEYLANKEREKSNVVIQTIGSNYYGVYMVDLIDCNCYSYISNNKALETMIDMVLSGESYEEVLNDFISEFVFDADQKLFKRLTEKESVVAGLSDCRVYTVPFRCKNIDDGTEFMEVQYYKVETAKEHACVVVALRKIA